MVNLEDLKIGSLVKTDIGIGKIVRMATQEYCYFTGVEENLTVDCNGLYYECTQKEVELYNE